jgi:DNA-binding SARP family transcriptional activator
VVARLALSLLGPFQATLDGRPAQGLSSDWRRALLAYLALEREREHSREQLAALLWPERPDQEALSALRYALSNLRSALGDRRPAGERTPPEDASPTPPVLLLTRTSARFNPESDYWLDVAEFQELSRRSNAADLERAVSLYRGPFLHGLSLKDSPAFEEWMLLQGEETRRSMLSALGRLTSLQMVRADYAEAARWARRQLEIEPYREQAHRQLIAALDLGGERSAALAQYEACRRLLTAELGCEPEDETRALYAQVRAGGNPLFTIELLRSFQREGVLVRDEAGQWAARLLAYDEATAHLERGLALLERTVVSLARLWAAEGRGNEARELLSGIYGWFAEGPETVELLEARALLDELA